MHTAADRWVYPGSRRKPRPRYAQPCPPLSAAPLVCYFLLVHQAPAPHTMGDDDPGDPAEDMAAVLGRDCRNPGTTVRRRPSTGLPKMRRDDGDDRENDHQRALGAGAAVGQAILKSQFLLGSWPPVTREGHGVTSDDLRPARYYR